MPERMRGPNSLKPWTHLYRHRLCAECGGVIDLEERITLIEIEPIDPESSIVRWAIWHERCRRASHPLTVFSKSECAIARLMVKGLIVRQIAKRLGIARGTVVHARQRMVRKIDAGDVMGIIRYMRRFDNAPRIPDSPANALDSTANLEGLDGVPSGRRAVAG